jgi:hypothetical protein
MQRSALWRRLRWAIAGALALHALLAVVATRVPRAPAAKPASKPPATVTVELRPAPKPVAPPAEPTPEDPQKARVRRRETARAGLAVAPDPKVQPRPAGQQLPEAVAPPEPQPPAQPQPVAENRFPWGSPEWRKAEGLDPEVTPEGGLPVPASKWAPGWGVSKTLRDPVASLGAFGRAGQGAPREENGLPVRNPTRDEALTEEKTRVEARLNDYVQDFQARERVRDVRDAYWQGVQDALSNNFHPQWELRDGKHPAGGLRGAIGEVVDQYARQLTAYGKTGSPLPPGSTIGKQRELNEEFIGLRAGQRGLDGTVLDVPAPQLTLEALAAAADSVDSPFHTKLVVRVLLTQTLDGAVEHAELAASSGNPVYDKLALDLAWGLGKGAQLGPPPKDHRRSLWAFDTDFLQMPPIPVAGCALDDFIPKDCFYPFKKSIKAGVRLEAVY